MVTTTSTRCSQRPRSAQIGCCGICLDARGLGEQLLIDGARRSTLEELAEWMVRAEKMLTF
jgi:uncharacterized protein involved in oxidation of intracellular sulfur